MRERNKVESLRQDTNRGSSPPWKDPMDQGRSVLRNGEGRHVQAMELWEDQVRSIPKRQAWLEDIRKAPEPGKPSSSVEEEEEQQQQGRSQGCSRQDHCFITSYSYRSVEEPQSKKTWLEPCLVCKAISQNFSEMLPAGATVTQVQSCETIAKGRLFPKVP